MTLRGIPHGEKHANGISVQPPGDESKDLGRLLVEPLRVVNHAQQRLRRGRARQHGERRQPHQKPVGRTPVAQAERGRQCLVLRPGKRVEALQERQQKLMQRGETEPGLRLNSYEPDDVKILACVDGVAEQRRLPYPGLATQNQDRTHASRGRCQDAINLSALTHAVQKHTIDPRRLATAMATSASPCWS